MKSFAVVAIAAFATVALAAENSVHNASTHIVPHRNATHHIKPWANATHWTDPHTNKTQPHFVSWHNGTHFKDPATNQTIKTFGCNVGLHKASDHFNKTVAKLHNDHITKSQGSRAARSLNVRYAVPTPISVPLYMHVITSTEAPNVITNTMVQAQVTELNNAYKPYGITFKFQNVSFTANDVWAVAAQDSDIDNAKQALRAGTYDALNLYFHTGLTGMLGTCTLPSQVEAGMPPAMYYTDGCTIAAETMPGGTMTGYNMGKTAVHETGHWFGLLHTFENYACTGTGDYIADTPMESASTNGCPTNPWKHSCPNQAGLDPVHNYMDYSTDACYTKFTPLQVQRMGNMWKQYRQGM